MLSIYGKGKRLCDGLTRRDVLTIGALGLGGLALPELLRAEAQQRLSKSNKAIIMIYLCGAPPHQDMFDLKMQAPAEIRGEFRPISTNVPGIHICEHLPRLARIMDKLVPIRTMYGSVDGAHDSLMCYTGRAPIQEPQGGWPSLGSTLSKLAGAAPPVIPPFVGLSPRTSHPPFGSPGLPGFLGSANSAFCPNGEGRADLKLQSISVDRLQDRKQLLASVDRLRADQDANGKMEALDTFTQQAVGMLTSSKLADALDVSQEHSRVRERYGKGDPNCYGPGAPLNLEHFLIARRLVEAGVRCVTLNFGYWDFHGQNFSLFKKHGPLFDQGMSALVEDLHERGLDKDVSVVAWGEFGRTPIINKDAGRDHWPQLGCALLAGGGMRMGQTIGATDRLGGTPVERPVHFGDVLATLYHQLGLDPNAITVPDLTGRPHYLVDHRLPMRELI